MKETVCQFGPEKGIVGILCEPNQLDSDLPTVIFLNAGLLHHVGPFGWYTTYARRLAKSGITSLRFDLSGIGESLPRSNGKSNRDMAIADVIDAMNELQQLKMGQRFILLGLCAGAVVAHHAAAVDNRIIGMVSIDGVSYRTKRFYVRHFARRLFNFSSWMIIWKRFRGIQSAFELAQPNIQADRSVLDAFLVERTTREEIRAGMIASLRRGMRMLQIYSGTKQWYFNHKRQFYEMFGPLPDEKRLVQVEYLKYADHLFTSRTERGSMFQILDKWFDLFRIYNNDFYQLSQKGERGSRSIEMNKHIASDISRTNYESTVL